MYFGIREFAYQIKVPAAKPEESELVPESYMEEGERILLSRPMTASCIHWQSVQFPKLKNPTKF